jgi:hypothetical protein
MSSPHQGLPEQGTAPQATRDQRELLMSASGPGHYMPELRRLLMKATGHGISQREFARRVATAAGREATVVEARMPITPELRAWIVDGTPPSKARAAQKRYLWRNTKQWERAHRRAASPQGRRPIEPSKRRAKSSTVAPREGRTTRRTRARAPTSRDDSDPSPPPKRAGGRPRVERRPGAGDDRRLLDVDVTERAEAARRIIAANPRLHDRYDRLELLFAALWPGLPRAVAA